MNALQTNNREMQKSLGVSHNNCILVGVSSKFSHLEMWTEADIRCFFYIRSILHGVRFSNKT